MGFEPMQIALRELESRALTTRPRALVFFAIQMLTKGHT
jgi:hypothetical protein